ncbi:MAG: hypothetical protein JWP37_2310 [Mucilaginibacter sp.]|nr:hypothetical protein [Mucilaginibacter sp.]
MIKYNLLNALLALFIFSSCQTAIKPEALYGKWKYVKVENPNSHPIDSVSSTELAMEVPYIQFSKNDSLVIWWGGKVLSHGTFHLDGSNIRVKEILADGKTREFPFYVSKLTEKDLIFSTSGEDGSKVTAVKE